MINSRKCNPEDFGIISYTINSNNSIDITQDVKMDACDLTEIPFKINTLSGSLNLSSNKLTSLKNAPKFCRELSISYNPISFIDKEDMVVEVHFVANDTKLVSLDNLPKCERIHLMKSEVEDTSFLNKMKDFRFSLIHLNKNKISNFLHPELVCSKVLELSFNPIESFDVSEQCGIIRMEGNLLSYEQLKFLIDKKYKIENKDFMLEDKVDNYKRKILFERL